MKCAIGIDPGQTGGIAAIMGVTVHVWPMPLAGKDIDLGELARILRSCAPDVVVIEKVHAMPGQGVSSTFKFGEGYGGLKGVAAALDLRVELVTPQAWQKLILAGTTKDKDAAVAYVRRAYPAAELTRKGCRIPHSGIADAVCIAEFGRRSILGG